MARFCAPLHALRDLNDAVDLRFAASSCTATVMDSTHVSLSFVSWICSSEDAAGDVTVSVKLSSLMTGLGLASSPGDGFSISMDSAESDTITLILDEGDTTVNLKLLESDDETMGAPSYDQGLIVKCDTARFRDVCKELSSLGDTVTFFSDSKNITLHTSGDIGTAKITLRPYSVSNPQRIGPLSISLRYLNSIMKANSISNHVTLGMVDGMPIQVGLTSPDVSLNCFVAPKIEDEDPRA
ncbi:MAG: hypothetical protein ACO35C_06650 [Pontimonas sp.]